MQLFTRRATTIFRLVLTLTPLAAAGAGALAYGWSRSDAAWNVGKPAPQPIPFRHDVHAGTLKIDCRYCHATVERAASAGMPSATTCMSCHAQVWAGASALEPLRTSVELDQPIAWNSVHRLPHYAYFHHGAHVAQRIPCEACHGRVDEMAKTVKVHTLSMGWCLACHRDPVPRLPARTASVRPPSQTPAPASHLDARLLTSCNTCHR